MEVEPQTRARHWLLRYDIAAFLACVGFFVIWPEFDLYITRHFFSTGNGFIWKNHILTEAVYSLTNVIAASIIIGLPILIAAGWITRKEFLVRYRNIFIFMLIACIIGPGVMVNMILKDNWGRPRPRETIEFQGDWQYVPPFVPGFECRDCHSFVSGHASVGFFFFSLALVLRNRRWLWLPVITGAIIGLSRMGQGGHYLSDILFSGWVVWFCSIALYKLFLKFKWLEPG